jgi:hypothetical protein
MDHFMYFQMSYPFEDTLFNFIPWLPEHYYNYLRSVWMDSTHLTYGGDGHLGSIPVNHALTGDPISGTGWLEPDTGLEETLYGIASSGPYDLLPGDTLTLELAYVFARDYQGDHLSSVALLKERIETIRWYYENDSTPCTTPWTGYKEYWPERKRFFIEPNPVSTHLAISGMKSEEVWEYRIIGLSGNPVQSGMVKKGQKIGVEMLSAGCYILRLYNLEDVFTAKFIKIE